MVQRFPQIHSAAELQDGCEYLWLHSADATCVHKGLFTAHKGRLLWHEELTGRGGVQEVDFEHDVVLQMPQTISDLDTMVKLLPTHNREECP